MENVYYNELGEIDLVNGEKRRCKVLEIDGLGRPIDDGPEILPDKRMDINGLPMNPAARNYPQEFIQTGVLAIDGINTLVRGQKLPIFSARKIFYIFSSFSCIF